MHSFSQHDLPRRLNVVSTAFMDRFATENFRFSIACPMRHARKTRKTMANITVVLTPWFCFRFFSGVSVSQNLPLNQMSPINQWNLPYANQATPAPLPEATPALGFGRSVVSQKANQLNVPGMT